MHQHAEPSAHAWQHHEKRLAAASRESLSRGVCVSAQETKQVFEKLYKYIGKDIKTLIDRTDASYVIRLQKNRVFYVREDMMRRATNVSQLCLSPPCADIFWCAKPLKAKHERSKRYWLMRMRARRSRGRSSYRWAPASGNSHTPASSGWALGRWTSCQNTQSTR